VGFTIAVGLGVVGVLIVSAELIDPALDLAGVFGKGTVPAPPIPIRLVGFFKMGWIGKGGKCLSLSYDILLRFLVIIIPGKTSS
jgi:hypothetical protein